jgi:hypothetical protein
MKPWGIDRRHSSNGHWRRSFLWRAGMLLLLVAFQALAPTDGRGLTPSATEDEVEAVYLYNFAKFIRWPQGAAGQTISLCVLNDEPVASALQRVVAGERVDGRNLRAKSLSDVSEGTDCNILFLGPPEDLHMREDLAVLHHAPVVTVSNDVDFLQQGGIIQFAMIGGAVRFSVNLDAARRAGVTLSSQLLKVALTVKGSAQAGTP